MKHSLIICMLILSGGLSASVKAQSRVRAFPDSVRIEFPDHQAIAVFEMKCLVCTPDTIRKFPEAFRTLLKQVRKGLPEPVADLPPHRITVRFYKSQNWLIMNSPGGHTFQTPEEKSEITLSEIMPAKTVLTVTANNVTELLPPGWEVIIKAPDYKVTLYGTSFQSLVSLTTENFDAPMQRILGDPSLKKLGKNSIISRIIVKDHAVANSTLGFVFPGDYLGFTPGAAVGVFDGQIFSELSLRTALYFSDRFGSMRKRIELTYDLRFNAHPHGNGMVYTGTNSFLSLSYGLNFRKGNERSRWTAIGVGYLLNPPRNGALADLLNNETYYMGRTLKFFLESDIGSSKLNIVPEFYLTDNLNKFRFGMKLAYRF